MCGVILRSAESRIKIEYQHIDYEHYMDPKKIHKLMYYMSNF